jgi:hypothetical protein
VILGVFRPRIGSGEQNWYRLSPKPLLGVLDPDADLGLAVIVDFVLADEMHAEMRIDGTGDGFCHAAIGESCRAEGEQGERGEEGEAGFHGGSGELSNGK